MKYGHTSFCFSFRSRPSPCKLILSLDKFLYWFLYLTYNVWCSCHQLFAYCHQIVSSQWASDSLSLPAYEGKQLLTFILPHSQRDTCEPYSVPVFKTSSLYLPQCKSLHSSSLYSLALSTQKHIHGVCTLQFWPHFLASMLFAWNVLVLFLGLIISFFDSTAYFYVFVLCLFSLFALWTIRLSKVMIVLDIFLFLYFCLWKSRASEGHVSQLAKDLPLRNIQQSTAVDLWIISLTFIPWVGKKHVLSLTFRHFQFVGYHPLQVMIHVEAVSVVYVIHSYTQHAN